MLRRLPAHPIRRLQPHRGNDGLPRPPRRLAADAFIAATPVTEAEAGAGMAEMSKVFRETGSELYMGAGGREHD